MSDLDTDIGGGDRRFPRTSLTLLRNAPDEAARRAAIEPLLRRYWKPVYCFIRFGWKRSNEESKDLTQDFFTSIVLEKDLVGKYMPERGSFHGFLKLAVTTFMSHADRRERTVKRGGRAAIFALDIGNVDASEVVRGGETPSAEEIFDRSWKAVVYAQAVVDVEQRLKAQGREAAFRVFEAYDLDPEAKAVRYGDIAQAMGLSEDAVKNHLTRAREEFRRAVQEIVSDYVDTPEDLEDEMRSFLR